MPSGVNSRVRLYDSETLSSISSTHSEVSKPSSHWLIAKDGLNPGNPRIRMNTRSVTNLLRSLLEGIIDSSTTRGGGEFSGLKRRIAAKAAINSQGIYSVFAKIITITPSIRMKIPVWRFESDISAGPIKACNNRSPGNPGMGNNKVHPIRVKPIPARPVR